MEYLEHFNKIVNIVEGQNPSCKLGDKQIYDLRVAVAKAYNEAWKEGKKEYVDTKEHYEQGRLVGHSLGYKEGLEAGKVIRKQRVLNSFGGR